MSVSDKSAGFTPEIKAKINELYSRQFHFGENSFSKLFEARVLIIGFNGLAVEVIKNLTLQGIGNIQIHDEKNLCWEDVENGYIFKSSSVGKPRLNESHVTILNNLNPICSTIKICQKTKMEFWKLDFLSQFDVIVNTEYMPNEKYDMLLKTCSDYENTIFVDTRSLGFSGRVITFGGALCPNYHDLDDFTNFKKFCALCGFDDEKVESSHQLHVMYSTMDKFIEENGRKPYPYNDIDLKKFQEIRASNYPNLESPKLNQLEKKFCFMCTGLLPPFSTLFGGFASSEVIKAVLSTSHHEFNIFYFSDFSFLPSLNQIPTEEDRLLINNSNEEEYKLKRYQSIINIFGKTFVKWMISHDIFIAGVGALGVETAKILCQLGFSKLHLCDYDRIETSNCSRQFLFSEKDQNKLKVEIAKNQLTKYFGEGLSSTIQCYGVMFDHGGVFKDEFFRKIDFCVVGFDTFIARGFCQEICKLYDIPMFNSGTRGWEGNISSHIPSITNPFKHEKNVINDDDEEEEKVEEEEENNNNDMKSIVLSEEELSRWNCSKKYHPKTNIDIMIVMKCFFDSIFSKLAYYKSKYNNNNNNNEEEYEGESESESEEEEEEEEENNNNNNNLKPDIVLFKTSNFEECVLLSIYIFKEIFSKEEYKQNDKMENILFNENNEKHLEFIKVTSLLFSFLFNISDGENEEKIRIWKPENINKLKNKINNNEIKWKNITFKDGKRMNSLGFDKDNNVHVNFITLGTNIYRKKFPDLLFLEDVGANDCQRIAGRLIPANSSTGSVTQGLLFIEFLKYLKILYFRKKRKNKNKKKKKKRNNNNNNKISKLFKSYNFDLESWSFQYSYGRRFNNINSWYSKELDIKKKKKIRTFKDLENCLFHGTKKAMEVVGIPSCIPLDERESLFDINGNSRKKVLEEWCWKLVVVVVVFESRESYIGFYCTVEKSEIN